MRALIGLLLVAVAPLVACEGTVDVGSNDQGDASSASSIGSNDSYTAAQVQAAEASCNAPHGPVDPYTDVSDLKSKLVGAWYLCGSASTGVEDASATGPTLLGGVGGSAVWGSDGSWTRLVPTASGGLTEGQGITSTGAFQIIDLDDASPSCEDSGCILGYELGTPVSEGPSYGDQFPVSFEASPRRMLLGAVGNGDWYVPVP